MHKPWPRPRLGFQHSVIHPDGNLEAPGYMTTGLLARFASPYTCPTETSAKPILLSALHVLESQLYSELDLAVAILSNGSRSIGCTVHKQEVSWVVSTTGIAVSEVEVWMVECIQHFRVDVHLHMLCNGDVLDDRNVCIK